MGLDQYAYVATREGQKREFWEGVEYDSDTTEYENPTVNEPREIAYWRKHPNLQGWMERLWRERGSPGADPDDPVFNGIEVELTWDDLDRLEKEILSGDVAKMGTVGFFFGNPSDQAYREQDLKFITDAKAEIFIGLRVFYDSSW